MSLEEKKHMEDKKPKSVVEAPKRLREQTLVNLKNKAEAIIEREKSRINAVSAKMAKEMPEPGIFINEGEPIIRAELLNAKDEAEKIIKEASESIQQQKPQEQEIDGKLEVAIARLQKVIDDFEKLEKQRADKRADELSQEIKEVMQ